MIGFLLSALLASTVPGPCTVPESMPALSEATAGEGDADWCVSGADPFAAAGPDLQPARQLLVTDSDGKTTVIQWRRQITIELPSGWRKVQVARPTTASNTDFHEVLFQRLADTLIVVTINPAWRVGNAVCVGEGGIQIAFQRDGKTLTERDRELVAAMASGASDLDPGNVMCTQLARDGDTYRATFHGAGGRPLPEVDDYYAGTTFRPVPLGDYERLLGVSP